MTSSEHTGREAEIRARLDAATPGPWSTEYDSYGDEWWFGGDGAGQNTINFPNESGAGVLGGDCRAEAELIANAPSDLAYLLEQHALLEGQLAKARHRHRAYPDAANPHAYCLSCRTGRKEVGSDFPEYMAWPCPDAIDLGLGEGATDAG